MNCERCGRPSWKPTGGMGGGLMPDAETHCTQRGGLYCRVAAGGYRAGLRDCMEIAEANPPATRLDLYEGVRWYDWTKAKAALAEKVKP